MCQYTQLHQTYSPGHENTGRPQHNGSRIFQQSSITNRYVTHTKNNKEILELNAMDQTDWQISAEYSNPQ
jgi:hypothetical protein